IICEGMQVLPLGLPKIMVSTLASGDVAPYVGVSDIIMMPSVTDLAGLNRLSRIILHNAASAIVGMSENPAPKTDDKPALGLTMFGVTTPAVTAIAELLADDYDGLIFHATGTGGRAMENLVSNDLLTGVLDITTTEIADLLVGGVLAASEARLDIIVEKALPYVGSVGALDMVNFWAKETVPDKFQNRNLYVHNANVTLMRTDAAECRKIGSWIGDKINKMTGPVRFLIPEKGISSLDIEGGAFFDPATDAVLFDTIENTVSWNDSKIIKRLPYHINDPEFAQAAVAAWREISN
ncbi:MAG: Tm-1-like ATP-binding domain-containing protein, partial [Rhizobiales bacterium]|nr:Tm-1-like ATP-binding domain-containing protein [Hyphomicrobiales bacterium]